MKKNSVKILKVIFAICAVLFVVPSIIYLVQNKTIMGFDTYYNFFIQKNSYKMISTITYLVIFTIMTVIYIFFIKKNVFKNIKQLLLYTGIIGVIFLIMLPWTSSDIFYYMGVGELDSVYGQNPYYVTMKEYYEANEENIDDEILEQGSSLYWSDRTVVYGPVSQMIFSCLTKVSFKNINVCVLLFKILNLIMHIANCYLIYKLTRKMKFAMIYALNPFIFLEYIANIHNDIIIVTLILLAIYFLIRKKQILPCVIFLAIATGMKYFAVLLLPVVILYHYKDEKKISQRLLRCIEYGLIFLAIIILEYSFYFRDVDVFIAVLAQNGKYCKSIYSAVRNILLNSSLNNYANQIMEWTGNIVIGIFIFSYFAFCMDLLTTKKIKFKEAIQRYNLEIILLLLCLTTFQQWYMIWFFATLYWHKSKRIKNIIILCYMLEIANSVYMFLVESDKFDAFFYGVLILGFAVIHFFSNVKIDKIEHDNRKKEIT